jgi:glycosyltransferase involved in cell wall biosynthesis
MKLLFIIDHLGSGGAQRQMVTLAVELARRGHTIELFIYHPAHDHFKDELLQEQIRVYEIRKKSRYSISIIKDLHDIIRNGRYELVLSFLGTPNFYSELVKLRGIDIPIVVSVRDTYPYGNISFWRALKEQFHRLASHVTVNSNHQRCLMEKRYPWIRSKISTIYNIVDMHRFTNSKLSKNGSRLELLAIGTICRTKNLLGVVRSLEICKRVYDIHPVIRWAGRELHTSVEIEYYEEVKQYISERNLADSWEWLGERSDIPSLLSCHHGLISGSFHEGLPNVICEALASGRPVLASNIGDNGALIDGGKSGYLFNPYEPNDIAKVILEFSELSQSEWTKMSLHARRFAENNLSPDIGAKKYEDLFKKLIK